MLEASWVLPSDGATTGRRPAIQRHRPVAGHDGLVLAREACAADVRPRPRRDERFGQPVVAFVALRDGVQDDATLEGLG